MYVTVKTKSSGTSSATGPVTSFVIENRPMSSVTSFVTVNVGAVLSPITKLAVPSSFTVRPSPLQVASPHSTLAPVPEIATSDSVTTVPVGSCRPAGADQPLPAFRTSSTSRASSPTAAGHDASTVNSADCISGLVKSKSPASAFVTAKVPPSTETSLVRVIASGSVALEMVTTAVPSP